MAATFVKTGNSLAFENVTSKQDFYKTAKSTSSNGGTTLRARLRVMHDVLIELIQSVQEMRKEVGKYKAKMGEFKKSETALAARERTEQQINAKRVEDEIKRVFSLQDIDNYRLKQQVENLTFDRTQMQQQFVELEKRYQELDFVIGKDEIPDSPDF
eukprot:TRINITY_DN12741_c0_g2_i6.p1 TRINITY_DN12741_c0_g2~~TRINITY_DN12741_c0_g2_i6.p1  ORF type:complete len:157 (-),score=42.87 TRINITY_DN12741_c0_g2_i6:140-610(-)